MCLVDNTIKNIYEYIQLSYPKVEKNTDILLNDD